MNATLPNEGLCNKDLYQASPLEASFEENVLAWTKDENVLCDHLRGDSIKEWLGQSPLKSSRESSLSRICRKGRAPQILEPLAGILRDPRFPCSLKHQKGVFSIEWLIMADAATLQPGGRRIFFDAGATHFADAMMFFAEHYMQRGVIFDEIYAWEAVPSTYEKYWEGVPSSTRKFWEPRVTFYNGVPVTAEPGDTENNPVNRIHRSCRPQDFCAFKLDIDTPQVEMQIVELLLDSPKLTGASLDEFFFEHHVHGLMQYNGWGDNVNGTFADSYEIFTRLRKMGVRAHSWI